MVKELIGMAKWKSAMKKYANMEPYSDEWWQLMTDSLYFLPEDQREMFMSGVIGMGAAM